MAQSNIERFCELLDTVPLAPIGDEFFGQMCSFQIKTNDPLKLKAMLYDQYRIEIPVMVQGDKVFIRYSINAFNDQNDLDLLYRVLKEIIALKML